MVALLSWYISLQIAELGCLSILSNLYLVFWPGCIMRCVTRAAAANYLFTLHAHYTLHITHYTLHITHYSLHITHYTLHITTVNTGH